MGFMSNREDEAALRRAEHRAVVVAAMRRAIDSWFAQLRPSPDMRRAAG
jgi:N-acetylmuramoyl-L-alanine amidase